MALHRDDRRSRDRVVDAPYGDANGPCVSHRGPRRDNDDLRHAGQSGAGRYAGAAGAPRPHVRRGGGGARVRAPDQPLRRQLPEIHQTFFWPGVRLALVQGTGVRRKRAQSQLGELGRRARTDAADADDLPRNPLGTPGNRPDRSARVEHRRWHLLQQQAVELVALRAGFEPIPLHVRQLQRRCRKHLQGVHRGQREVRRLVMGEHRARCSNHSQLEVHRNAGVRATHRHDVLLADASVFGWADAAPVIRPNVVQRFVASRRAVRSTGSAA